MTVFTPLGREEVIVYLGAAWPAPDGSPLLRLPDDAGMTDGAVSVYPNPGQPGTAWWAVDSVIPPQAAGIPDEALAALIPGSVLIADAPVTDPGPPPEPPPT